MTIHIRHHGRFVRDISTGGRPTYFYLTSLPCIDRAFRACKALNRTDGDLCTEDFRLTLFELELVSTMHFGICITTEKRQSKRVIVKTYGDVDL